MPHINTDENEGVPLEKEIKTEPMTSSDENSSSSLTHILGVENKPQNESINKTNDMTTNDYQMKEESIVDVHNEDEDYDDDDNSEIDGLIPIIQMNDDGKHNEENNVEYDNNDDIDMYDGEESKKRRRSSRGLLNDYGPSLHEIHRLWQKNTEIMLSKRPKIGDLVEDDKLKTKKANPMCWTTMDVADYVRGLPNCNHVGDLFEKQDIDGVAFLSMSENDLDTLLDIKLGPAVKIYNQIVQLREEVNVKFMIASTNVKNGSDYGSSTPMVTSARVSF